MDTKFDFFFIFLYKIFLRAAGGGKSHMENIHFTWEFKSPF